MGSTLDLGDEAKEALCRLVEAHRVSPEGRQPFLAFQTAGDFNLHLNHPGLSDQDAGIYPGDLDSLADRGLVRRKSLRGMASSYEFDLTQLAFQEYTELAATAGDAPAAVEDHITSYIGAHGFRRRHAAAYGKCREALDRLWAGEEEKELTTIGHLCREATQEFATSLLELVPGFTSAPEDKQLTKARVQAVLQYLSSISPTEEGFLKALLGYWAALTDLVQRQEHGATKEGQRLAWEDARRVAFQTLIVMYEIDRSVTAVLRGLTAEQVVS